MEKEEYKRLVAKHIPKEPKLKNIIIAFIVGGFIGFMVEFIAIMLSNCFAFNKEEALIWTSLILILLTSIFTGLGFFDNWVKSCKCGLIIPTTGFAHSVSSSAIDYRNDGLITGLGSNFFKLAGSVIIYGIISSFLLVVLKVIING